jgi:ribonuclease R
MEHHKNNNSIKKQTVKGTFKPHPKGFGFINGGQDEVAVFVGPRLARGIFHGDVVECLATVDEIGRLSAETVTVLEKPRRRLAATMVKAAGGLAVRPEWGPVPDLPLVLTGSLPAILDDRVVVEVEPGDSMSPWRACVVWNGGPLTTRNVDSALAMAELKIPAETDEKLDAACKEAIARGNNDALQQGDRKDLRALPFMTIDGRQTKDMDDAIYVEALPVGYRLHVAIADVAQFVTPGSPLDVDARLRGTTVYFSQQTVPMLPRELSNGACSLNEGQDRAVLVATMTIDRFGQILETELAEAWICSKHRLNYEEVTAAFDGDVLDDEVPEWKETLQPLRDLYDTLLTARIARGSAPIRSGEVILKMNENGKVESIEQRDWHIAYGLVEECMLAANTGVANWMRARGLDGIYRFHNGPDQLVWDSKRAYFESIGLVTEVSPTPSGLSRMSAEASLAGHGDGVDNAVRGSMRSAQYRTDETSHFSLAYPAYTHFTSPIRRYADLSVHRVIKAALRNEPALSAEDLSRVAAECTAKDLRAKMATRSETKRLKHQFATNLVGKKTKLTITGGNTAGWFAQARDWHIDGFVLHGPEDRRLWAWDAALQRSEHPTKASVTLGTVVPGTLREIDLLKWRTGFTAEITPGMSAAAPSPL